MKQIKSQNILIAVCRPVRYVHVENIFWHTILMKFYFFIMCITTYSWYENWFFAILKARVIMMINSNLRTLNNYSATVAIHCFVLKTIRKKIFPKGFVSNWAPLTIHIFTFNRERSRYLFGWTYTCQLALLVHDQCSSRIVTLPLSLNCFSWLAWRFQQRQQRKSSEVSGDGVCAWRIVRVEQRQPIRRLRIS